MALSRGFSMPRCTRHVIAKSFYMSSRQYAVPDQTLSPEHQNSQNKKAQSTLRDRLRRLTGFSLTASRATLRAATGVSLTAIYASTLAATGLWIRKVMHVILSLFPAWVSWLLQPRQNCLVSCLQSSWSSSLLRMMLHTVPLLLATLLGFLLRTPFYSSRIKWTDQTWG